MLGDFASVGIAREETHFERLLNDNLVFTDFGIELPNLRVLMRGYI